MNESSGEPAAIAGSLSLAGRGLPRRRFLKHFVFGSAFSAAAGRTWVSSLAADCQPTQSGAGILRVTVADFPALQNVGGSVRLALNPFSSISQNVQPYYPVLINRGSDSQFYALRSRCGHQGCVVGPFIASQGASVCPCHGSRYDIDGSIVAGPTLLPLTAYRNSFDGTVLCVEIPGLGYSVTGTVLQTAAGSRFKLQFATRTTIQYAVLFRQSLTDPGTAVPFAVTETGAATSSVFTATGTSATLYVDRSAAAGFYSVAVQVTSA